MGDDWAACVEAIGFGGGGIVVANENERGEGHWILGGCWVVILGALVKVTLECSCFSERKGGEEYVEGRRS